MKNLLLLSFILFLAPVLSAQNGWTKYDVNNGLFTNEIVKLEIANDSSIWLATAQGVTRVKKM